MLPGNKDKAFTFNYFELRLKMFRKSFVFIKSNIQISLIYLIVSVLMLFTFNFKEKIPFIILFILFLFNIFLFQNFFITASELIKDESKKISIKKSFFRFDKKIITELLIFMVFLAAISAILLGPKVIISLTPLKDIILNVLRENFILAILFKIVSILFTSFYSILISASMAHIIYSNGRGTFESIKEGFKTIFKLKTLLFILIILNCISSFTAPSKENLTVFGYFHYSMNIFINLFIFVMSFFIYKELENIKTVDSTL